MARALKIAGGLLGLVVLALVAAALILPQVLDPNDYRGRIAAEVKARTGRELTLTGPIELSVFPWLGLALNQAALGNAPGFGEAPFLAVEEARVKVRLLPLLLRRDVEVATVMLREPRVRLEVDRAGRSNWEDLTQARASQAEEKTAPQQGPAMGKVVVGGVELSAADVLYDDRESGTRARVKNFNLSLGRLAPGERVPLRASGGLEYGSPGVSAPFELEADVRADPQRGRYVIEALALDTRLAGEGLPQEGLPLALRAAADADLEAATAAVSKLELAVLDATFKGSGRLLDLKGTPTFDGTVELAPMSPRRLLEKLGTQVTTADPKALTQAAARIELRASSKALDLGSLSARLDDTELTGNASLRDYAQPRIRFDLRTTALDVDRYLAPPEEGKGGGGGGGDPQQAETPPEPGLRLDELGQGLARYDLAGKLALAGLKVSNLRLSDVRLTLRGKGGTLDVDPLEAGLYEGRVAGNLGLDARGAMPVVSARQRLENVSLGPLLKDLMQREPLTGRGAVQLELRAQGNVAQELLASLGGELRLDVADGVLKGINLDRSICQARGASDLVRGKEREACDPSPDSRLTELRMSTQIASGVARSEDLTAVQPRHQAGEFYRVTGAGSVNLPRQEVDYLVRAVRTTQRSGQTSEQEKGRAIPVRIAGTFDHLSIRPDLKGVAEAEAREKLKEKLGDKLETKDDDSDLERQGKELLRGILGR